MDLLDDSGDEGNGRAEAEVDENILLNSDDEEDFKGGVTKHSYIFQSSINEEELLYEGDEDEEEYVEEDVLDLELGDEELETPDLLLETHELAPVKYRAVTFHNESQIHEESYEDSHEHDTQHNITILTSDGDPGGSGHNRHVVESSTSRDLLTQSQSASAVDSDDDDEPRHRSRFQSERKTEDMSKHSISSSSVSSVSGSEGLPITTLGERNPRLGHVQNLDSRRGRGGFNNMRGGHGGHGGHGPRHLGPRGMGMMGGPLNQRHQRPPSLLGDRPRPRPGLLRFPNYNQIMPHHPQGGHPVHQLQGGFIDFNQPIRPLSKSIRNTIPQNVQKPQGQSQGPPTQQNKVNVNNSNQNPNVLGKPPTGPGQNVNIINKPVQVATGGAPKAASTISPKRPAVGQGPRQPLVRQMRPRMGVPGPQNQNQFIMGPRNSGPMPRGVGPRHRHPQPQPPFRPGGPHQQQWHPNPNNPQQQMPPPQLQNQQHLGPGPRGQIIVIGPGNPQIMNRRLEPPPPEQFNNFNVPMGLMGPHPGQQQGHPLHAFHDGFQNQNIRQPFPQPQPRFPPPDEMLHQSGGGVMPGPQGGQLPIPPMQQHQQLPPGPGGPGGPHHTFMPPHQQNQNFPPPPQEQQHSQQQHGNVNPFYPPMRQGGEMHRDRSPQMNYSQGPPHQHQHRFPPPGQEQSQQQLNGPPLLHEMQSQPPLFPLSQQKIMNRQNPFREGHPEHSGPPHSHQQQQHPFHQEAEIRPNPFYAEGAGARSVSIEPNPILPLSADYSDSQRNYYKNAGPDGAADEPRYRAERERDSYDSYERVRDRDYERGRDSYEYEREREYERDRDRERERNRDRDRYYEYEERSSSSGPSGRDYRERRDHRGEDYYEDSRSSTGPSSRLPVKRVGDFRDDYSSGPDRKKYASPEKRLDGRLGPPVAKQMDRFEDNTKQDEVIKIIQESQKVMGLDADYLRKIEEQKAMRAQILQEKEHRRKKQQLTSSGGQGQSSSQTATSTSTAADDNSRREVRILNNGPSGAGGGGGQSRSQQQQPNQSNKPKVSANAGGMMQRAAGAGAGRQDIRTVENQNQTQNQSQVSSEVSSSSSKSIYVNPRAFHGDLSVLNSNLKMINMNVRSVGGSRGGGDDGAGPGRTNANNAGSSSSAPSVAVRQVMGTGTTTSAAPGTGVAKKRTILRIVRNKKGEIISKSKVIVLPKGSLLRGSTTTQ